MGTTLGAPPFSEGNYKVIPNGSSTGANFLYDIGLDSTLWSSELLQSEKGKAKLTLLNETWVKYGAEIIGSCT